MAADTSLGDLRRSFVTGMRVFFLAALTLAVSAVARESVPRALWRDLAEATLQAAGEGRLVPAAPRDGTVRVDVIATDARGRIVDNLQPADFELREDGTLQTVDEARFIRTDGRAGAGDRLPPVQSETDEHAEASRDNSRLFGLFLDEYHVNAASSLRVRSAMIQFVDDHLGPRDLIVVMRPLDSLFTIRMTRDRSRVRQAIEEFAGRKGEYAPRNAYERNYIAGTPARIEQLRAQVAMSALNALALHLGSLGDRRKTLVVVSEGLPRIERRRGLESLPTADSVMRSANRSNVSIYPVDPRELTAEQSARADDADALRALAAATDGQSIVNGADLAAGMRPIVVDSSAYYLLVYQTAQQQDGKFHDVQVRVKRPGVHVRTRKGYWATLPDEALRANLSTSRPPMALEPPRHISPLIRPWFGASRGVDGKTRLTFVWEPAARVPGDRAKVSRPSKVVLKALGSDGTPLFEGSVLPTGSMRIDAVDEGQARAVFDAPPGQVRLRMSIEDETAQPIDSDVRDIAVRDLTAPVVLGTPQVLRARTARDFRTLESDPNAVPVASREFSRAERLLICVPVYAPAGVSLTVSARLMNRAGQAMRDLSIQQNTMPAGHVIDLPLAGLAAGPYLLEVTARSPAGAVKDLLEFRVTN